MVNRRSNKGTIIDMDAIMAANEKSVAVGNMGVNAKGETVQDGVVVQSSEDRVRAYYKNNPKSSTAQASIKGQRPTLTPDANEQQPVMDVQLIEYIIKKTVETVLEEQAKKTSIDENFQIKIGDKVFGGKLNVLKENNNNITKAGAFIKP